MFRRLFSVFLVPAVLFLVHATSLAASPSIDVSQQATPSISLTQHLGVLEDPSRSLTIESVQQAGIEGKFVYLDSDGSDLRFGYTESAVWVRLELRNTGNASLARVLELGYAPLSRVDIFQTSDGRIVEHQALGSGLPFAQRLLAHRYPAFDINLAPHSDGVYFFRLEALSALIVPAKLWRQDSFLAYQRDDYFVQALYFGMAAAMLFFNLMLFVALRDRIYLLYVCFVGAFALGIATQGGLAQEFLWPHATDWSARANYVIFSLAFASLFAFMREMLETRALSRGLDVALKWGTGFFLLSPLAFLLAADKMAEPMIWFYLGGLVLVLVTGVASMLKEQRSGYLFMLAFLPTAVGSLTTTLRGLSLVPTNLWTVSGMQFGSALEMVLLALALADRFSRLRSRMVDAQAEVLKAKSETVDEQQKSLAAQQDLIAQLKESERTLEQRVRERTEQLESSNQKLEVLSTTDDLTGVFNRRHFDAALQAEFSRARRTSSSLAIALIDVDWFKKYNDNYGHQAGDECLKKVTAAIVGCAGRAGDTVARYGGEEFAVIAADCNAASAKMIGWRICEAVRALAIEHAASPTGHVTVSVGIATCTPSEATKIEAVLRVADKALYRAKDQGRNCVVVVGDQSNAKELMF